MPRNGNATRRRGCAGRLPWLASRRAETRLPFPPSRLTAHEHPTAASCSPPGRRRCSRAVLALPLPQPPERSAGGAATVDGARIVAADREPQNWLTHGRTYGEQRYSPLAQINDGNVGEARPRLVVRHRDHDRGLEATPDRDRRHDVHDRHLERGLGARREDRPRALEVRPRGAARSGAATLCCDAVNRGVARLEGRGLRRHDRRPPRRARRDDRREALGGATPSTAAKPYTHHGRAARGEGQGDHRQRRRRVRRARLRLGLRRRHRQARLALLHRARQSARTASSTRELAEAAQDLERRVVDRRRRRHGVGLDGLRPRARHCSTSAPATARPGARDIRSPRRRRQPLSLVDPRAGSRHRAAQAGTTRPRPATPGTTRPRSTSSSPTCAIGGKPRKVLMQAPKNGFFYVLDRVTGELLSAEKFAPVTWASHVDLKTGRPVETPRSRTTAGETRADRPGAARRAQLAPDGLQPEDRPRLHPGHAADVPLLAVGGLQEDGHLHRRDMFWNPGIDWNAALDATEALMRAARRRRCRRIAATSRPGIRSAGRRCGRSSTRRSGTAACSPPPATCCSRARATAASSLYAADTGRILWALPTTVGIIAPPVTYAGGRRAVRRGDGGLRRRRRR